MRSSITCTLQIKNDKMGWEYSKHWRYEKYIPEGKRPVGRPRRRREDNIRIGLREMVWEGGDLL
jgi:hypothetical protein